MQVVPRWSYCVAFDRSLPITLKRRCDLRQDSLFVYPLGAFEWTGQVPTGRLDKSGRMITKKVASILYSYELRGEICGSCEADLREFVRERAARLFSVSRDRCKVKKMVSCSRPGPCHVGPTYDARM